METFVGKNFFAFLVFANFHLSEWKRDGDRQ